MTPILWQKIEGALVFASGMALFHYGNADFAWWLAIVIFFAPDLSFVFYGLGPKIGAIGYNSVHNYGFGAVMFVAGTATSSPLLTALGALWIGHSGFDRMLGYGLKSSEGFHFTHLGQIGNRSRV